MAITRATFPLPDTDDPLTAGFFAAAARDQLAIPRCASCNRWVWYPAPRCSTCGAEDPVWTPVSGRGRLFTWAVVQRAFLPAFADRVPFVTAIVVLDEDPSLRVCSYLLDSDETTRVADARVRVEFCDLAFSTVPDAAVRVPMFRIDPSGATA
jgi:uncharacterized OB-fold protein